MLVVTDVRQDPVLSNISIAYKNEAYIAELIMPEQKINKSKGNYYVYDRAMFRVNDTKRAPGAEANTVEYGLSKQAFEAVDHALKGKITWDVIEEADTALAPETDETESLTEMIMVDEEVALATVMIATASITNNVTLAGTDQWSDYTNSDPIGDVKTARQSVQNNVMRKANTFAMGQEVFDVLCDHPDVVERVKYSFGVSPTEELIARIFKVDKVLVGAAQKNTATEGQTDSMSYIWGKNAWLIYISKNKKGKKQITFGWTMKKKKHTVKKWDNVDQEARYVRVNKTYTQELVAEGAAYLIKNAVA